ncbi:MAG: acyl-CoA dehydrogenase family protein, partial [Bacteroidota bacterium]
MNVEALDNLQLIRESARDFAETYIRPHVMEWDESQHFPVDVFRKMGEYGFMGVLVPEAYGGSGL